jgi:hypothetical protein
MRCLGPDASLSGVNQCSSGTLLTTEARWERDGAARRCLRVHPLGKGKQIAEKLTGIRRAGCG